MEGVRHYEYLLVGLIFAKQFIARTHHQLETHLLHVHRVEQCREQSNRGLKFHVVFPWGMGGGREEAGGTLQEAVLTRYSIPDNPKIAQPLLLPS